MKTPEQIGAMLNAAYDRHPLLVLRALRLIVLAARNDDGTLMRACQNVLSRAWAALRVVTKVERYEPCTDDRIRAAAAVHRKELAEQAALSRWWAT